MSCARGGRLLFSNVNFVLNPGDFLQLTGANGSGKTSLLRILCGLLMPESGAVLWNGAPIRSFGEEYGEIINYLGHRNAVKEELNSIENLRIANGLWGAELETTEAQIALARVGLAGREHLPARFLSEGQRRRCAIARLITRSSPLWLLDEVLASLDHVATTLIESIIGEHLNAGGMAIVATHQELRISASSLKRLELEPAAPAGAAGAAGVAGMG